MAKHVIRTLALLAPGVAGAHMVSFSSGELQVEGRHATYELRMPLYEVADLPQPEQALFAHFTLSGARLADKRCRVDKEENALRCGAIFEWAEPPDTVTVDVRYHSVTVPNHVHLLRAARRGQTDQAVFDLSFPRAELRFRPPTRMEAFTGAFVKGAARAAAGPAQLLFLASLVLAARRRRELYALAAMFLAGEVAAAALLPLTSWQPAPRFVEAAAALTIAYLAVEILFLPQAGARWAVAGVLGVFHGLYFGLFLKGSGHAAFPALAGVVAAEVALLALFASAARYAGPPLARLKPERVGAVGLLVIGMAWFFLRLRG